MSAVKTCWNSFSSWLYPTRCALCSVLGDDPICSVCLQDFLVADHVRHAVDDGPLRLTATLFPYRGRVSQAVRRLKYSRATVLAQPMADLMLEGVDRLGIGNYDWVVPIPIHWSRRCTRGFNQSELLAEALPNVQRDLLLRTRRTKPQARLSREARMHNLAGAFRARAGVSGKSILLIDDVLTSGETARECARALAAAGATDIAALAFAGEAI
jgi:ComF family protein